MAAALSPAPGGPPPRSGCNWPRWPRKVEPYPGGGEDGQREGYGVLGGEGRAHLGPSPPPPPHPQ